MERRTTTELDGLRDISRRARIAYALCCLERVTDTHHLDGDAWQDWRERAWRMTSAPKDPWHTRAAVACALRGGGIRSARERGRNLEAESLRPATLRSG